MMSQIEALKLGMQALSVLQPANWVARNAKTKAWDAMAKAIADAEKQQALEAMADNERELGIGLQSDRQALQAAGMHPAPCARHCEANAFEIAARGMRKQITELQEALDSMRGRPVDQIDTSAKRVEKEAGNKHVCPPNCGTGYCSCIECLKGGV